MAHYCFRCECGETDVEYPIGHAPRTQPCKACGGVMRLVIGVHVHVAPSVFTPQVRSQNEMEKAMPADRDAYKRYRQAGLQPKSVQGSAQLEHWAHDQTDLTYGPLPPTYKEDLVT